MTDIIVTHSAHAFLSFETTDPLAFDIVSSDINDLGEHEITITAEATDWLTGDTI